jgi:hypothetical protein
MSRGARFAVRSGAAVIVAAALTIALSSCGKKNAPVATATSPVPAETPASTTTGPSLSSKPLLAHNLHAVVQGTSVAVRFDVSKDVSVLIRIRDGKKAVVGSGNITAQAGSVQTVVPLKSGTAVDPSSTWQLGLALSDANGNTVPVAITFHP